MLRDCQTRAAPRIAPRARNMPKCRLRPRSGSIRRFLRRRTCLRILPTISSRTSHCTHMSRL